jgi:hypothetical protein
MNTNKHTHGIPLCIYGSFPAETICKSCCIYVNLLGLGLENREDVSKWFQDVPEGIPWVKRVDKIWKITAYNGYPPVI